MQGEVLLRYLQSKDEQMKERFMWHGMVKDVVNMVSLSIKDLCITTLHNYYF